MATLDLRAAEGLRGRAHFGIRLNDRMLAFAYIRKNACTAFKEMILAESPHPRRQGESPIGFLHRCHLVAEADLAAADNRICVLRDPADRLASLYRNKFIQRRGHGDVFDSFRRLTGLDPERARFRDLAEVYLSAGEEEMDPHFHTQASHLAPVTYDHALRMEEIGPAMRGLLGAGPGARHFSRRANASAEGAAFDDPSADAGADILRGRYLRDGAMPTTGALLHGVEGAVRAFYAEDQRLLDRLSRSAEDEVVP